MNTRRLAAAALAAGLTLTTLTPAAAHDWKDNRGHHGWEEKHDRHEKWGGQEKWDHKHRDHGRWSDDWEWPWDRDHHDRWNDEDGDRGPDEEPTPAPPEEPTPQPTAPGTIQGGTDETGFITGYTIHDNDPPGTATIAYPILHEEAGGTGTYEDPITAAVPAGTYDPGTRLFVPHVDRYFIVEDLCATSHSAPEGCTADVDLWIGGTLDDSAADTQACAEAITGDHRYIVDPPRGLAVAEGPLFDSATDTCYEPTPNTTPGGDEETGGESTGGTDGEFTNREGVRFEANGLASTYHVYAEGVTEPAGLLFWADGSGGNGIDDPDSTYLLDADGDDGLVAVARESNMILVVPEAPDPGCDGYDNCWYDSRNATEKAEWSAALMDHIKAQYDIDTDRIAVGGYSSGAQWATRWFVPNHGEDQSVDLAIAVAYGGAPYGDTDFSAEYAEDTVLVFNTGTADEAYTSASWGAIGGANWYENAGFTLDATWPDGVGHARGGEFDDIVAAAINEHL